MRFQITASILSNPVSLLYQFLINFPMRLPHGGIAMYCNMEFFLQRWEKLSPVSSCQTVWNTIKLTLIPDVTGFQFIPKQKDCCLYASISLNTTKIKNVMRVSDSSATTHSTRPRTQINLFEILLNQPEIRLYLSFPD